MYDRWIANGLKKAGKNRDGLAHAIGRDPSVVSKIVSGLRTLKAEEINKAAAYLEEPPPSRMMPISYSVGAGQVIHAIESDDPADWEPVAGMWGIDAELAVIRGDSMYPYLREGSKLFFGQSRAPSPRDHLNMRVVRLADDRMLLKIMKKTADPMVWTLESLNAPPIEDVVVTAVAEIIRIDPQR